MNRGMNVKLRVMTIMLMPRTSKILTKLVEQTAAMGSQRKLASPLVHEAGDKREGQLLLLICVAHMFDMQYRIYDMYIYICMINIYIYIVQ